MGHVCLIIIIIPQIQRNFYRINVKKNSDCYHTRGNKDNSLDDKDLPSIGFYGKLKQSLQQKS